MKTTFRLLRTAILALGIAALSSCATPANIAYFQDAVNDTTLTPAKARPIRLKPNDQISVIVNSLDPQVTAMFNLPYYTTRIGETQTLTSTAGTGSAPSGSRTSPMISATVSRSPSLAIRASTLDRDFFIDS